MTDLCPIFDRKDKNIEESCKIGSSNCFSIGVLKSVGGC